MAWILRLVQTGAEGEDPGTDLMEISRPDGLGDIAKLGLTLSEVGSSCWQCISARSLPRKRGTTSSGGQIARAALVFAT